MLETAAIEDGRLLRLFVDRQDAAAFETLVRLHGPMVYGVCRRVLQNHHDAEEAFQATFLVLARKADAVAPRDSVGNWLYGVAYRTALKSRTILARRRVKEQQMIDIPEPDVVEENPWPEFESLLDQELSRLPEKYRTPVVLCDLEGKTHKEAARQLGCPEGTVSVRLKRARTILAKRLARRGLVLSTGSLMVLLCQTSASAGVPSSVVAATVEAAGMMTAQHAAAAGVISANVATLTQSVLKSIFLTRLRNIGLGLASCAALLLIVGFLTRDTPADARTTLEAAAEQSHTVGLPATSTNGAFADPGQNSSLGNSVEPTPIENAGPVRLKRTWQEAGR